MFSVRHGLVLCFALVVLLTGSSFALAGGDLGPLPDTIFADGFESGDVSVWTLAFSYCGDNLANGLEECDGTDLAGLTCAALGFSGGGVPGCTGCCTAATVTCVGNHTLGYERIPQTLHTGDLTRVRWHPSGRFALILTDGSKVLRYDTDTDLVTEATDLGATAEPVDLDAAWNGQLFLIVGSDNGVGRYWEATVNSGDILSFSAPGSITTGSPVAVRAQPHSGHEWAIAIRTGVFGSNFIALWNESEGLHTEVSYTAGAGVSDLMWRQTSLQTPATEVVISHGWNGADSKTFELDTGLIVDNGFPGPGFSGNLGGAGWRGCAGTYGFMTAWSNNRVIVYDGTWAATILPGSVSSISPNAVGWRSDGTRALVVGRAVFPTPLRATVYEHQPGTAVAYDDMAWVDVSIPDFDQPPWLGNSNQHLLDVDWQPQSDCDGGLIAGMDDGTPGFGLLIRFFDSGDSDCTP